jgi:hypothetical protein
MPSSGAAKQPSDSFRPFHGKDSQTGQNQVTITATNSPAIEATYTVKGVLYVEGVQTDVRELDLKIRQRQ